MKFVALRICVQQQFEKRFAGLKVNIFGDCILNMCVSLDFTWGVQCSAFFTDSSIWYLLGSIVLSYIFLTGSSGKSFCCWCHSITPINYFISCTYITVFLNQITTHLVIFRLDKIRLLFFKALLFILKGGIQHFEVDVFRFLGRTGYWNPKPCNPYRKQ